MTIGNRISYLRKQNEMTQEALACKLGVSNQAVSKWEADQCCPDIQLLPVLADVFQVSIDSLFGRTTNENKITCSTLPWEDDKTLRVVAFIGQELQDFKPADDFTTLKVTYEGDALDIQSCISVHCMSVNGDINAGSYVKCGPVRGNIAAGAHVECGPIIGDVAAGAHVQCGDISGDVAAGSHIQCEDIGGDACSHSHINCNNIRGDAHSEGGIYFNTDKSN